MTKNLYTTEYYGRRKINYRTAAGLGFTQITIFTADGWDRFIRNNKTGYCKNYFTDKRISQSKWDELYATTKPSF